MYPSSVAEDSNLIGKNCFMLGIELKVIELCLKGAIDKCFSLNNGAVSELDGLKIKSNQHDKYLLIWYSDFTQQIWN